MADQDATICVELTHVVKDYRLRIERLKRKMKHNEESHDSEIAADCVCIAELEEKLKTQQELFDDVQKRLAIAAVAKESQDVEIKCLRRTIDEIKSRLDHKKGLYDDCAETVNKLHELIAQHSSTIANKDAEIEKLSKTIAGLNESREQQITTVQNLEATRVEIDDLKSIVVQLSTTIERMSLLDDTVEKKYESYTDQVAALEEENEELYREASIWHRRAHPGCHSDRCLHLKYDI